MFKRQRTGSALCTSCGSLVGVSDDVCYSCGRRNPTLWGFAPSLRALGGDLGFVPFVIGTCVVVYLLTLLYTVRTTGSLGMGGMLNMFAPSTNAVFAFGASGAIPIFGYGRWWTVFSATWLHGSALHILMNLMWVRQLAPLTADLYGPARMVIIYFIAGIAGFALSSFAYVYLPDLFILRGSQLTVGASASIFGLFGAHVHYGRRAGSRLIGSQALSYALTIGVLSLFMGNVDNYAHLGGFAGGYLASLFLDPLKPARIDHVVIALSCLAASILAIAYSFFTTIGL
jgi:rhomboid protease GluP